MMQVARQKAERFLALHRGPRLLVLPNIWDPMGARLLEHLGYPAVATASAAVAYSLGYEDGEVLSFDEMLGAIERIAASVSVPVTADIERGYADDPDGVGRNIREVIRAGAVGINIEDSLVEGGALRAVAEQCDRIRAAREAADAEGVPLVINARTDVWLSGPDRAEEEKIEDIIERGRAYLDAAADCLYPVTLSKPDALERIRNGTGAPLNVYASKDAPSIHELEAAGIARLSLGPGLVKATLGAMGRVAKTLLEGGDYNVFLEGAMQNPEIQQFVRHKREEDPS